MTFKYVLIAILGLFLAYVLALPRTAALRKGFILAFIGMMMIFTFKPEWSSAIAQFLGVGRGADLLFYLSHLVLFFVAFMYYLKFKDIELKFAKLVRRLAIDAARESTPGKHPA